MSHFGLDQEWDVLSVNKDVNGLEFVSSIEHKRYGATIDFINGLLSNGLINGFHLYRYPFYGVQFHPEKNIYEWIRNRNIPHSSNAIITAQYFATFFVDECRKNDNHFESVDEENKVLIYNFPTTFTGLVKSAFEQSYLFKSGVRYPSSKKNNAVQEIESDNGIDWRMFSEDPELILIVFMFVNKMITIHVNFWLKDHVCRFYGVKNECLADWLTTRLLTGFLIKAIASSRSLNDVGSFTLTRIIDDVLSIALIGNIFPCYFQAESGEDWSN